MNLSGIDERDLYNIIYVNQKCIQISSSHGGNTTFVRVSIYYIHELRIEKRIIVDM